MLIFTRSKINKFVAVICLFVSAAIFSVGCAPEQKSGSLTTRDSLEAILYAIGTLESVGIMPRALPVPVTSGETPYGFLVNIQDASLGVLIGFNGFTQQEINESANQIIPFVTSLLEESLEGTVTTFTPSELAGIGLSDSQSVHNVILTSLLSGMDFYIRCYVTKVDGPQGPNIRMDFYGWATDLLEPGQFLIRLEFQENVFDQLLQLGV